MMKRFIREWLMMLAGLLMGVSISVVALAAKTAPQPPSSPPSSVLGLNLSGGFTQQPIDMNVISGSSVTISVKAQRSALEAATSLLNGRKYVWWQSSDGQTYQKVGSNSQTYTFTAPQVTTTTPMYFQVQYAFSGIGTFPDDWSRVATINVTPARVPTTGIKVTTDDQSLNNSQTTTAHAALTPSDATDPVTWTSSNSDLATVDQYGNVTAADASTDTSGKADDHGLVTITGTSNGISDSTQVMVGALQDVTVVEGTPATFKLESLPDGLTVSNWYRVKNGQVTALNQTGTSYTINSPTNADDDGTSYYASLSFQVNGKPQTVTTNAALLTVKSGGKLALTAVPNLNFGSLSLDSLAQGTTLNTSSTPTASGDGYDGNDDGKLAVTDARTVGGDWQLSAQLDPFTNQTDTTKLAGAQLDLKDTTGKIDQVLTAGASSQSIYTQSGYQGQTFTMTPSTLKLSADPSASTGQYQSTILWTLATVPGS